MQVWVNILIASMILFIILALVWMMWITTQRLQMCCDKATQSQTSCPIQTIVTVSEQVGMRDRADQGVAVRDRAVNDDQLYPPLNRLPTRVMSLPPVNTNTYEEDRYRMIGYMINANNKEDAWKLYGREKRRGVGEFYLVSANKNVDVKIALTNDMLVSPNTKLRDLYDIPEEMRINHPMFSSNDKYTIAVMSNADLGSNGPYV